MAISRGQLDYIWNELQSRNGHHSYDAALEAFYLDLETLRP